MSASGSTSISAAPEPAPAAVAEYAARAVEYVARALGLTLEFDSDTLPVLDHYLHSIPKDEPAAIELVAHTAGAYFGEVVRRRLGGRWEAADQGASDWRLVLPTGVNFSPAGFVLAAIMQRDLAEADSELDAPSRMKPHLQQALARMGEVTAQEYYSLCGRLDSVEHVHEVLVAVAAQLLGEQVPGVDDGDDGAGPDEPEREPDDEPGDDGDEPRVN